MSNTTQRPTTDTQHTHRHTYHHTPSTKTHHSHGRNYTDATNTRNTQSHVHTKKPHAPACGTNTHNAGSPPPAKTSTVPSSRKNEEQTTHQRQRHPRPSARICEELPNTGDGKQNRTNRQALRQGWRGPTPRNDKEQQRHKHPHQARPGAGKNPHPQAQAPERSAANPRRQKDHIKPAPQHHRQTPGGKDKPHQTTRGTPRHMPQKTGNATPHRPKPDRTNGNQ